MNKLLLLLILFSVNAFALDECYTGSWFEEPGEGINIEVLNPLPDVDGMDERTIGYFYTYGPDGNHRWYVMDFGIGDVGPMYSTNAQGDESEVGSASLDAIDSKTLLFVFNITQDLFNPPWCLDASCVGELVMTRLTGSCN